MVSMVSQAALAEAGLVLIILFRSVGERIRKIHDFTMESAMIHSSVGGSDVDVDPSMWFSTLKLLQCPLKKVILFSIHNDEWKSFQCHHQTALRSYALSWKPCQGDSLNLPDHRIHKDGDGDTSFQLKSDSLPHAHAQTTKTFYKHKDSRIMKAQELKTKTSAQTLIYKIFLQRYQVY
ncbi:hypothetical protein Tco_0481701 [Tanacetum coccineum]